MNIHGRIWVDLKLHKYINLVCGRFVLYSHYIYQRGLTFVDWDMIYFNRFDWSNLDYRHVSLEMIHFASCCQGLTDFLVYFFSNNLFKTKEGNYLICMIMYHAIGHVLSNLLRDWSDQIICLLINIEFWQIKSTGLKDRVRIKTLIVIKPTLFQLQVERNKNHKRKEKNQKRSRQESHSLR